jgi:hypothetical protein
MRKSWYRIVTAGVLLTSLARADQPAILTQFVGTTGAPRNSSTPPDTMMAVGRAPIR